VTPALDNKVRETLLLCRTCSTVDPMPSWTPAGTHSPTAMEKDMELLNGGVPLSVAQIVITFVALPCAQVGVQLKTPSAVRVAPAGAEPPNLKVTGAEATTALMARSRV